MGKCKVTFHPGDKEVFVSEGTDLLSAAVAAGIQLHSDCGGEGVCGACKVIVREGDVSTDFSGRLTDEERAAGYCLACCTTVHGDVQVEVPRESLVEQEQILTEGGGVEGPARLSSLAEQEAGEAEALDENACLAAQPLAAKLFLRLPPPTASDNISDLERLYREIRRRCSLERVQIGLANLRRLARLLRESDWGVTVTLGRRDGNAEVVLVEPGDTSNRNYAVVVDVGTTTVVASLIDMNTRQVVETQGAHNPQSRYGEDVITRIIHAEKGDGLQELHSVVVEQINEMISRMVENQGLSLNEVMAIVCAGNTTMTHLLLQVDPTYIRRSPYVPTVRSVPVLRAREAGIRINPRGLMACIPGVSSYVGGDITAGVLASGIDQAELPSMLIDLGTNGEIVMGNREWMVCCSASAGPAFEGSGVKCGVLAMQGAVQKVRIDAETLDVSYEVIGQTQPVGICGSGYLDLLAELFRCGLVDRQGKLSTEKDTPRLRMGDDGPEFVLAWADESGTGADVVITQTDIENLIRSKGAVYSAAKMLVDKMGMSFTDLDKIYISGGFGSYLNIEKAIMIGLLPDLPPDRFEFIGNSSLSGSRMVLLSLDALIQAEKVAGQMTNIELSEEPSYMGEYMGALFLPHTNIDLFPSVMQKLEEVD